MFRSFIGTIHDNRVSKFYRNNSRQPGFEVLSDSSRQPSFEVLSEQFTTTEFRNTLRILFSQVASQRCFWNITKNALSFLLMLFYYI